MHRRVRDVSMIYQTVGWESDCQIEKILNDVITDLIKSMGGEIAIPFK